MKIGEKTRKFFEAGKMVIMHAGGNKLKDWYNRPGNAAKVWTGVSAVFTLMNADSTLSALSHGAYGSAALSAGLTGLMGYFTYKNYKQIGGRYKMEKPKNVVSVPKTKPAPVKSSTPRL